MNLIKFTPELIEKIVNLLPSLTAKLNTQLPLDNIKDESLSFPLHLEWKQKEYAGISCGSINVFLDQMFIIQHNPQTLESLATQVKRTLYNVLGRQYLVYGVQEIHKLISREVSETMSSLKDSPSSIQVVKLPNHVKLIMGTNTLTVTKNGDVKFTMTCENKQIMMAGNQLILPLISDLCSGIGREEREFDISCKSAIINQMLYVCKEDQGIVPAFEENLQTLVRDPYTGQMVPNANDGSQYHSMDVDQEHNQSGKHGLFNY